MSPFRSLRKHLLLQISLTIMVIGTVILVTADTLIRNIINEDKKTLYHSKLQIIIKNLEEADRRLQLTHDPETYRHDFQQIILKNFRAVYYKDSRTNGEFPAIFSIRTATWIAHPELQPDSPAPARLPSPAARMDTVFRKERGDVEYALQGRRKWAVFTRFTPWNWLVFYTLPLEHKYGDADRIRSILVVLYLAMTALAGLFFYFLSRRLTDRIEQLDRAALQLTAGTMDAAIPPLGNDEVGRLALSFESMRRSILVQMEELDGKNRALREEITHRTEAEEKVRTSLEEKDALLREIHHRVKNNLQTISSLLRLQLDHINNQEAAAALRDSISRVHSMALVHEQLYRFDNLAEINMRELFERLLTGISTNANTNEQAIRVENRSEPVILKVETAIPCALIVNELVTNAFKHAFPDRNAGGEIILEMHRTAAGLMALRVCDNGCGMPEGAMPAAENTLGLKLVHILARQLRGTIELETGAGTCLGITFPPEESRPAAPAG